MTICLKKMMMKVNRNNNLHKNNNNNHQKNLRNILLIQILIKNKKKLETNKILPIKWVSTLENRFKKTKENMKLSKL